MYFGHNFLCKKLLSTYLFKLKFSKHNFTQARL
jgi:hypothetical protein